MAMDDSDDDLVYSLNQKSSLRLTDNNNNHLRSTMNNNMYKYDESLFNIIDEIEHEQQFIHTSQ
jgi:hypothetical protein